MNENQEKRLKRGIKEMGLDALLSEIQGAQEADTLVAEKKSDTALQMIDLNQIAPNPEQPRKVFDPEKLQELSDSIQAQGVLQPILVRPISQNSYQIVAGERRFRAARMAGLQEIPAIVRPLSEEAVVAISLIENIQRHDLNPIEEAKALQRLVEEFYMSHQKVAEMVGKSRVVVTHALRLLSLDPQVKAWLAEGLISVGHAKLFLPLAPAAQVAMATAVIENALSVRETEQRMQAAAHDLKTQKTKKEQDPDIARLQGQLSKKLNAPVILQHSVEGKGRLIIQYHSLDELEGILAHIV